MLGFRLLLIKILIISAICICKVTSTYSMTNDESDILHGEQKDNDEVPVLKGFENSELFPRPGVCGPISAKMFLNVYGGSEASLGDFTWLANLEYKTDDGDLEVACAGNIINKRYILTAAHCVTGEILIKKGQLVSVRVGDHNIDTAKDCNEYVCIDPPQYLGIEKVIAHENYRKVMGKRGSVNDIALLRVDRDIEYSKSVAPVCLPSVVPTLKPLEPGMKLTAAGWGHIGSRSYSPVKLTVSLPYVANENCTLSVDESHLCAGGRFREDTCSGDSGGGIFRLHHLELFQAPFIWIIEGIVSYGRGCGLEEPSVYTRVTSFMDWIQQNVLE
uniref:Peptidase S1 domain-containing protein n=1 Tax=Stomoxys calcitrans TaxID=35570 RepID=A0A1I8PAU9_STOCA